MDEKLKNIMPDNYGYRLAGNVEGSGETFSATVRLSCISETEFVAWLDEFKKKSHSDWNKKSVPVDRFVWRQDIFCQHGKLGKTKAAPSPRHIPNGRLMNTGCLSMMKVTIKRITVNTKKKDAFVKAGFPTIVDLKWCHNHDLLSADALSYRRVAPETKLEFWNYFGMGMNVTAARTYHRSQLELRDDFGEELLADASVNPTVNQLQYLFNQWREVNQGGRNPESVREVLKQKIELYKEQGHLIDYLEIDCPNNSTNRQFAIAVITPLMQRVHGLQSAAEICFMDSSSSCDDEGHVLTFILTATTIGALPLGFLITDGQSIPSYAAGFSLIKKLLGKTAFCGRKQPAVFMTDDSAAEKTAIEQVWPWPESVQYLCQFHVAQAMWRWLWNNDHCIIDHDRKPLMELFRKIMYATTSVDLENAYLAATTSAIPMRYSNFIRHVDALWDRRPQWTLFDRLGNHACRGHHTNNFSESAVRVYKDVVLSRCKAYNSVSLVEFTCHDLENHYVKKLREFAHNRNQKQHHILKQLLTKSDYIRSADQILYDSETKIYAVPSAAGDDGYYNVDPDLGLCVCVQGATGKFCKHQAAVMRFFDVAFPNAPAVTSEDRQMALELALGKEKSSGLKSSFFASIHEFSTAAHQSTAETLPEEPAGVPTTPMELLTSGQRDDAKDESAAASAFEDDDSAKAKMRQLNTRLQAILDSHIDFSHGDPNLLAAFQTFVKRAERAPLTSSIASLLASSRVVPQRLRSGRSINSQVTSISRRRIGITRGAARLPENGGRRPKSAKRNSSKRHKFSDKVKMSERRSKR